jgi:hypothetical protein
MHPYLIELEAEYRRQRLTDEVHAGRQPVRWSRTPGQRRWHGVSVGRRHSA